MFKSHLFTLMLVIAFVALLGGCGQNQKSSEEMKKSGTTGNETTKKTLTDDEREKAKQQTIKNLKDAIKGETTASKKYAEYSKKAKEEGLNSIAKMFEATSKSESIHAQNHISALEQLGEKPDAVEPQFEVKSTKDNLMDAIKGETYEVTQMYPAFLSVAEDGKVTIATISFNYAMKTEERHKAIYENALDKLQNGKENTLSTEYYVCPTCGNTYDTQPPNRCGISMTSKDRFIRI